MTTTAPRSCAPRFGTPRDPSRKTIGGRQAKVARALGMPMMPWQRHVADVAGEIDPATGDLYYREVVVTVPRQSGKTTEILSVAVDRGVVPWPKGRQTIVYAAQTRNDSRQKLVDEQYEILKASPFAGLFRGEPRTAAGSEGITWRNGSRHKLMATKKTSGHGRTIDLAILDEFFAQVDDRLEGAVRPAMITRDGAQLWVISTAGDAGSIPFRKKIDAGRERSLEGQHGRVAYFEYSAPDDADPADPATWWSCMPALGHTVTEAAIETEYATFAREGKLDEFCRAYLNQWRDGQVGVQAIPAEDWKACAPEDEEAPAPAGRVAFAVDVAPDSSWAAVAVAGRTAGGNPTGQVIDHRPGTSWVVPRLVELQERWDPLAFALDPASQAAALLNEAIAAELKPLLAVTTREYAAACGALYNAATSQPTDGGLLLPPVFRHRNQAQLNAALAGAAKRRLQSGDGWTWDRRASTTDISPLVAVTLASWAYERMAVNDVDVLQTIW
ncbi:terminase large subunit domain-containing protein [Blastococcus sp. TF02A-26]|uniref:terminase large subunit domain-containing protein n=1 Tax=Blastococcus sp. TF02A-26 TaxID=2250577 RepID=UPI000DE9F4FC|nr:terminase large subunit [Blastococcus sp. TF02A-26]RBY82675.1 terminase [Blastococcus sp. TF02A-26]